MQVGDIVLYRHNNYEILVIINSLFNYEGVAYASVEPKEFNSIEREIELKYLHKIS